MKKRNIPLSISWRKLRNSSINSGERTSFQQVLLTLMLCFLGLSVHSCGKNETEVLTDLAKDYYPLQIGKTLIYDIDTIIYDPQPGNSVQIDTYRWQIKEVFVDTFKDITGLLTYKIERSQRRRGSIANYEINKIFTAALSNNEALRTEDNLKFIKFPRFFGDHTTWDGNVYCDPTLIIEVAGERIGFFSKTWHYEVLSYGKSEKIGTKDFADLLTIRAQSDTRILTEKRYNLEKYAKGIGLVYKEQHILDTQKLDATIAWEKKAERGYIVKQTIVSFQ